ncbi:MAG: tetratricopeptide repeat protein [Spirochaetia bacterium]
MKKKIALLCLLVVCLGTIYAQSAERDQFLEAESRFRSKNYELALNRYEAFLRSYPLSRYVPDAQFHRAVTLYRLGRHSDALALFGRIEERYQSTRYFQYVPFWTGVINYELEDYESAIADFQIFLENAEAEDALIRQARLYKGLSEQELGQSQEAVTTLTALLESADSPVDQPYALAVLLSLLLNGEEYETILSYADQFELEEVAEQWRSKVTLYFAEANWNLGNLETARELYENLTDASADVSSVALQRLFQIAQSLEDEDEMTRILQEAEVSLSGRTEVLKEFWIRIGIASYNNEKYGLAESYFQRVWNLRDSIQFSSTTPLYLAEIYLRDDRTDRARNILTEYLSMSDENSERLLLRLADIEVDQENWTDAREHLDHLLSNYPESDFYNEAGYLYAFASYKLGEYEDALSMISSLFSATQAGEFSVPLLRLRYQSYQQLGDYRSAIQTLEEYIPLNRSDIDARVALLKLYFSLEEYNQVISSAETLVSDMPDIQNSSPGDYYLMKYMTGLSHISMRDYEAALTDLDAINRDVLGEADMMVIYPYVLFYSGWSHYRMADYQSAISEFSTFLETQEDHSLVPRAAYLAGWCSFSLEDYTRAISFLQQVPSSADTATQVKTQFLLGKSYLANDNQDQAAVIFQNIFTEHSENAFADDALFEYAGILAELGNYETAVNEYYQLYEDFPNSPLAEEALYKRGELLYSQEQYSQARDAFYQYRTNFPNGSLVEAALYWGGIAAVEEGEPFGAVLVWERLITEHRDSPYRSDAIKRSAEIYAERGDFREAINLYSEMIAQYPEEAAAVGAEERAEELRYLLLGLSDREAELSVVIGREGGAQSDEGREAMIELARLYIFESGNQQDLALSMLEDIISYQEEDPDAAARAQFLIGEYYYRQSELVTAGNQFLRAAIMNPQDRDLMAMSLYRAAEMMMLADNTREANELVERLISSFPDSQWAEEGRALLDQEEE